MSDNANSNSNSGSGRDWGGPGGGRSRIIGSANADEPRYRSGRSADAHQAAESVGSSSGGILSRAISRVMRALGGY